MSESEMFSIIHYGLIGISGALSCIFFASGFGLYITRLGTERRSEGLKIMEWAVGFASTLIVLIALFNLFKGWYGVT